MARGGGAVGGGRGGRKGGPPRKMPNLNEVMQTLEGRQRVYNPNQINRQLSSDDEDDDEGAEVLAADL